MAIHAFCHIIWWGIIGFAVVLAITEATKPWASRYRPDYMSRCNPAQRKAQVLVAPGKPLGFAQQTDCDPAVAGTDFVKDGRCAVGQGVLGVRLATSGCVGRQMSNQQAGGRQAGWMHGMQAEPMVDHLAALRTN
jgi:hypothetical protein